MDTATDQSADYDASVREWQRQAPLLRRLSARIGLQGKLVLSFIWLLALAIGASCWTFITQSTTRLSDLMGEQARQVSSTLAMASEHALRTRNWGELTRVGQALVKSRNIVFVSFLDAEGKPIILCSRDLDLSRQQLALSQENMRSLMQVRRVASPMFGEYLEVVAPILTSPSRTAEQPQASQLLGYVAVGVSQQREEAQLRRVNMLVIGIGCIAGIISLPLAWMLVQRIFLPIRELVDATRKITGGDLDTRVAVHRTDVIGDLARSFNEMVMWVKKQRQDIIAANEKLAEANRDLEAKVEQRTAQLETANKRLASEIAEKEDFLRAVSHDLNAPLRNIAGMATMLLMKNRDKFDEDVVHRLERIKKNVDVETELIAELLELSRIKTRRQKMESVDVEALVWELRGIFENDLKTRGIDLVVDSALPPMDCERARIRQVFQNLVDNAIKYMGDRVERRIHIGCAVRMTEVEFYVRDTGIGIEPDDLDKVFFVFRRGRNQQVQNIAGKGVGLASVKSIIETYNGKIWVESQVGKGSTFRFTINGKFVPMVGRYLAEQRAAEQLAAEQLAAQPQDDRESSRNVAA